jgi:anti-sigma B factor antagonist
VSSYDADAAPPFAVTVTEVPGRTIVSVSGEIDLATANELRERLLALVAAGSVDVILDLDRVAFVDSTGLGALVATRRRFQVAGGLLVLVCSVPLVLRLLRVTSLDRVLPVHRDLESALAYFAARDGAAGE